MLWNYFLQKGLSVLHVAAKHGHVRVVQLLLQKEADPNAEGKNGLVPLHVATHYNQVEVMVLLLKNGASPQQVAKVGLLAHHCNVSDLLCLNCSCLNGFALSVVLIAVIFNIMLNAL